MTPRQFSIYARWMTFPPGLCANDPAPKKKSWAKIEHLSSYKCSIFRRFFSPARQPGGALRRKRRSARVPVAISPRSRDDLVEQPGVSVCTQTFSSQVFLQKRSHLTRWAYRPGSPYPWAYMLNLVAASSLARVMLDFQRKRV